MLVYIVISRRTEMCNTCGCRSKKKTAKKKTAKKKTAKKKAKKKK